MYSHAKQVSKHKLDVVFLWQMPVSEFFRVAYLSRNKWGNCLILPCKLLELLAFITWPIVTNYCFMNSMSGKYQLDKHCNKHYWLLYLPVKPSIRNNIISRTENLSNWNERDQCQPFPKLQKSNIIMACLFLHLRHVSHLYTIFSMSAFIPGQYTAYLSLLLHFSIPKCMSKP